MPPVIYIRRATAADLPAIVRLLADDFLGQGREQALDPLPDVYRRAFAEIDAQPNQFLAVAELDGMVVGTFQLTILSGLSQQGCRRAQIEAVRVHGDMRGMGIGEQMMRWAIERAREGGCGLVQLTTHKDRTLAHHFYTRLGFTPSHVGMKLKLT